MKCSKHPGTPRYVYPSGREGYCRRCHTERQQAYELRHPIRLRRTMRKVHLKRRYGLTIAQYETLKYLQGGCCKMCGRACVRLVVDHCHKTDRVRGLLCMSCNLFLGFFENDLLRQNAERYLRGNNQMETLADVLAVSGA